MFWGLQAKLLEMIPLPFSWYNNGYFKEEMGDFAPKGSFHEVKWTKLFKETLLLFF